MKFDNSVLKNEEAAIFRLRSLYQRYGYAQYKMSKFEEYDLYIRNKDFLVSDNIITFNDTDGRLLALKPDVTLSIIKNSGDVSGFVKKVYYNENVYRVSKGSQSFKEIMQVGLECIGDIDSYNIFETVMLAAESLKSISEDYILDISHMGIVSSIVDGLEISEESKVEILKCVAEKNLHGICSICQKENADAKQTELLGRVVSMYGKPCEIIPQLESLAADEKTADALVQLTLLSDMLTECGCADNVRIDFSVIHDINYYNGIVFKGFVNGIPTGILSGGQYDRLMKKMNKSARAIGFAVYLDMLERLQTEGKRYDVDVVLLYDSDTDIKEINSVVLSFTEDGKSVMAQKSVPEKLKYKQLVRLKEGRLEILEYNS